MKRTNGTYAEYDYNTQGFYTDNAYKIQYDLNGGARLYSTGGQNICGAKYNEWQQVTYVATRPNYKFLGWSTVKNATESDTLYLPGTSHNSVQIKGDTTLYAQWGNIFATITYNDLENYGELEPTYIPYTENISVSMLKHPGPGAQIFQGWRVLSKNYSADIDFNCYSLSSDSDQSLKFNSYNLAPIGTPRPRAIIIYNTDGGL